MTVGAKFSDAINTNNKNVQAIIANGYRFRNQRALNSGHCNNFSNLRSFLELSFIFTKDSVSPDNKFEEAMFG